MSYNRVAPPLKGLAPDLPKPQMVRDKSTNNMMQQDQYGGNALEILNNTSHRQL